MSSDDKNFKPRIYLPGPNIKQRVKSLKSAISDRPPFCSGTVPIAPEDLALFYRKPTTTGESNSSNAATCLNLTKATESDLEKLTSVCQAATFGMNDKDVLDLSYRKAWKLDPEYFATKLNILHAGLMESIRYNLLSGDQGFKPFFAELYKMNVYGGYNLLSGDQGSKPFFAELYKLNVYGKGSFFKPHKDTPRGVKMFGSLVVVLPTVHEGGTLVIRHGGKEWKIDSDSVDRSSISYSAFYSDVEHEVLEVRSGFRVTLTYNLYFGEAFNSQAIVSVPLMASKNLLTALPPHAGSFQAKLAELLADDTFLPMGGQLGFGLFHEYPFVKMSRSDPYESRRRHDELKRIEEVLKGNDAVIMQASRMLGLTCVLNICYAEELWTKNGEVEYVALCDSLPMLAVDSIEDESFLDFLLQQLGVALTVNTYADDDDDDDEGHRVKRQKTEQTTSEEIDLNDYFDLDTYNKTTVFTHWVTKMTPYNTFEDSVVICGNEASLYEAYGRVCLIMKIGPPGQRSGKPLEV